LDSAKSPLFIQLENHVLSRTSLWIAFLWGFAEATLFFIVPDVYLILMSIIHWRRGVLEAFLVVLGAVVGGSVMYWLAVSDGAMMIRVLDAVPLISLDMIDSVSKGLDVGFATFFKGPVTGVPFKIYAVQAGVHHIPYFIFVLLAAAARLERILAVAIIGGFLGNGFKRFVQTRTKGVVAGYILMWAAIYVGYYLQFRP